VRAPIADLDGLTRYLEERRALLVLDNCKHVLDAAAALVERVVGAGPEPVILATSREPLGVAGEEVRRVRSLGLPDPYAGVQDASRSAAVRLLVERVASGGGFGLDANNVGSVVAICRHLDGIPLALELAAARMRVVPAAEVAARLGDRFKILGGGSTRAQERHRTLQAAVDWSYDLLSDNERDAFRRMAVFPATFDLAAAEAVIGGAGPDAFDCVAHLVDRSLVQYQPDQGRYGLLETLRQYAADRLGQAGETAAARERHARYFLAFAERLAPETRDRRYDTAQLVLTAELDNLHATVEWCAQMGCRAELAAMTLGLRHFLFFVVPAEAMAWYAQLADHAEQLDPQALVDVLGEMAYIAAVHLGDGMVGDRLARGSVELATQGGALASPRACLTLIQAAAVPSDDPRQLLSTSEQARKIAEARGDEILASTAMGYIGIGHARLGDHEAARRVSLAALERAERTGHRGAIASAVILASSHYVSTPEPDFESALGVLERYDQVARVEDTVAIWLDATWGSALVGLGRTTGIRYLARAIRAADRLSIAAAQAVALDNLAIAVARAGHRREAATLVGYCNANIGYSPSSGGYPWILPTLEGVLAGMADRAVCEAGGAALSRSQVLSLVNRLETLGTNS
jgi:predicted ATPase